MTDSLLILLSGAGAALGVGAAQTGGPMVWNWRPRMGSIQHRLRCLPRGAPSTRLRAAGAVLLTAVLAGGALAAYAAAPSGPEQLPAEVKGVVGSGDQLSLRLKAQAGVERTIKVGEDYRDGWKLEALTPTQATLTKDGETRAVGLNPSGELAEAAPATPSTVVTLAGVPDDAQVRRLFAAAGLPSDMPVGPRPGLTEAETRRLLLYARLTSQEMARRRAAAAAAGGTYNIELKDIIDLLGQAAFDDQTALGGKAAAGAQAAMIADLAARPVAGPTSYYVPAGANEAQVVAAQGIDRRGVWEPGRLDAQGGRTFTLTAATAEQYAARAAAGPLPPPMAPPPPPPPPAGFAPAAPS